MQCRQGRETRNFLTRDSAWAYVFISRGYIPRSGIAELNGKFLFTFKEPVKLFFKGPVPFYMPVSSMSFPISPHPCQHLRLSVFFIITIVVSIKWYLVVLICISLMTDNVEHLLKCIYYPYIYLLWWNVFSNLLPIFKLGCVLLLSCQSHKRPPSIWSHLHERSRKGNSLETESMLMVAWGWKMGMGLTRNGHRNLSGG